MKLDRVIPVLTYTTILALGASLFCIGVLWSFPLNVPAWFAAMCACAGVALASGIGEIVLRHKRTRTPLKAAVR